MAYLKHKLEKFRKYSTSSITVKVVYTFLLNYIYEYINHCERYVP
jgi:hypothetical protein